jgi:hypothetical protein
MSLREKFGKQFLAWAEAERRFIPVQVVIDSKTRSGKPIRASLPRDNAE